MGIRRGRGILGWGVVIIIVRHRLITSASFPICLLDFPHCPEICNGLEEVSNFGILQGKQVCFGSGPHFEHFLHGWSKWFQKSCLGSMPIWVSPGVSAFLLAASSLPTECKRVKTPKVPRINVWWHLDIGWLMFDQTIQHFHLCRVDPRISEHRCIYYRYYSIPPSLEPIIHL